MVKTKSRIGRNWAKYLKLYKIVQILINVPTKSYRTDNLEPQSSLHTHSLPRLPITTGAGQTNTHCYSSYLYIRKENCQPMDLTYANLIQWVTNTHSLYSAGIKYPDRVKLHLY